LLVLLDVAAAVLLPLMNASASVKEGKLLSVTVSEEVKSWPKSELTFSFHAVCLRLAVVPTVVYAWLATNSHSIELGRAPLPLPTRCI
jgi:hypothetical protein